MTGHGASTPDTFKIQMVICGRLFGILLGKSKNKIAGHSQISGP
jgi:hypothetical protein